MPTLKKGSAAAKAFMAKLRAAKGKSKPKAKKVVAKKTATKKVGAVKLSEQKLIDIASDYAYATSGNYDRAVYNLLDPDFTKILLPKYKAAIKAFEIKNKTKVRVPINKKVGATENDIKVTSNVKNRTFTIKKNGTTYRTGKFSKPEFEELEYNTQNDWSNFLRTQDFYYQVKTGAAKKVGAVKKVMPTKKASSMHKDTKSHNVNIRVVSGMPIFEYKVSRGGKYYVSSNIPMKAVGIIQTGNGTDHKRGLKTYLFTDNALKKMQKFLGKENTTYIESDY